MLGDEEGERDTTSDREVTKGAGARYAGPSVMLTMLQTLKNVEHSGLQCYDCSTLNGIEPISFSFDSAMVTGGADPCGSIASESEDLAFDGAVMMTGDMEPRGSIMSESEALNQTG